ncbi:MAG: choice-of-anchor P family protein [Actinomycetota bacterium]
MAVVVLGAAPRAAGAPVGATESGSAVGVTVSANGAALLGPLPASVSATAASPERGFGPLDASLGPIGTPALAEVGALEAATQGTLAGGKSGGAGPGGGSGAVSSQVSLLALSVASGLVSSGAVTSSCTSGPGGSTAAATFAGLTVAGTAESVAPAPNTTIAIPGLLRLVLNEQVATDAGHGSGILVRALDLQVLPQHPGGAVLDVVAGESQCSFTPARTGPNSRSPTPVRSPGASPSAASSAALATPSPATSPTPTAGTSPVPSSGPSPLTGRRGQGVETLEISPAEGPPGAIVHAVGSGFSGCRAATVALDGVQLASVQPGPPGGSLHASLTIPGDVTPGLHRVTVACSGRTLAATTTSFRVVESAVHRSAFVTSLVTPSQVSRSLATLLASVAVAAGAILVVAFPSELFNSTLDEHYDEVRGWFGLGPVSRTELSRTRQFVDFTAFVLVGGVLAGLVTPGFGWNLSSLALASGLAASLVVVTAAFTLPQALHLVARYHEWASLRVLPGAAVIALICVLLSRAVHFQPGYLFGLIAGLEFERELAADTTGRLTLLSSTIMLAVGFIAWAARTPLAAAAAGPHASFLVIALEACLSAIFVIALESAVFALLPMRFLEGVKLTRWSKLAWAATWGCAVLAFVEILLQPGSGYVSPASGAGKWTAVALFVAFGLLSVAFWAYFRFRPAPAPRAGAERRRP